MDLSVVYRFRSFSRLTPFIGGGVTYWSGSFSGYYYASEQVYTPPWDYEYRYLSQDFSVFDSQLGYLLETGVDYSLGKHFRVGLDLKYRWIPEIKCEVEVCNEGFSSPPLVSNPIRIDASGWNGTVYLMFRF